MQPPRSPRQRQRQNQPARKQVPYGRPQQLAREGSVISTFKNFVKDTMGWLGSGDSSERRNGQNDVNGKRRHVGDQPPPPGVDDANGDDNHRVKRVRRDSPPSQQGYNDPPAKLFRSASSLPFPLHPISDNSKRRTLSPQASLSHDLYSRSGPRGQPRQTKSFSRMLSPDPPFHRPQNPFADPSYIPLPVSREASYTSPEPATPPSTQSTLPRAQQQQNRAFHLRPNAALLPTDQNFGPEPKRKSRERTEQLGESALDHQPGFVKRPRIGEQHQQDTRPSKTTNEGAPEVTLGTLAEKKRGVSSVFLAFFPRFFLLLPSLPLLHRCAS